eukprot:TRINITY_DN1648_c0_g2_i1.p1 TRINITY_DN1648_c0_g2~~TRINITY_DN1648_c0_g2_i1.p1  ORF type:complete len:453 (-),score=91.05 TRINITY_DN1648_c0_g2_i1:29-1354(-)
MAEDVLKRYNIYPEHPSDPVDYMTFLHGVRKDLLPPVEIPLLSTQTVWDQIRQQLRTADRTMTGTLHPEVVKEVLSKHQITIPEPLLKRCMIGPGECDYEELVRSLQDVDVLSVIAPPSTSRPHTSRSHRSRAPEQMQTQPPFGVLDDGEKTLRKIADDKKRKFERVEMAFRAVDTSGEGSVSRLQFQEALDRLKLYLQRDELDAIYARFMQGNGRLDYLEFVQACVGAAQFPEFLKQKSARCSGDIFGWSTDPKQVERLKVLFSGKIGVLNDNYQNWGHGGSTNFPFKVTPSRGTRQFNVVREERTPSRSQEDARKVNPLLVPIPTGGVRKGVDALPSDRDGKHAYGKASRESENIADVLSHVFMYDWMDHQHNHPPAQLSRRYHTKTSQMRRDLARQRPISTDPYSFKMSKFRDVPGKTQTRFNEEMEIIMPTPRWQEK